MKNRHQNQAEHDRPTVFKLAYQISKLPNRERWREGLQVVANNYGHDFAKQVAQRAKELYTNSPLQHPEGDGQEFIKNYIGENS